jgi:hypothetical protein
MPRTAHRQARTGQRRGPSAPRQASPLYRMDLHAAGMDVWVAQHWVAVPDDRDPEPVRQFGAFTMDLYALAEWLCQCRIETVVMESPGVYWMPLFDLLDERGGRSGWSTPVMSSKCLSAQPMPGTTDGCKNCIPMAYCKALFDRQSRLVSCAALCDSGVC